METGPVQDNDSLSFARTRSRNDENRSFPVNLALLFVAMAVDGLLPFGHMLDPAAIPVLENPDFR